MNTHTTPPTLDPAAAAKWARQARPQSPWLHEEVAQRMCQRLDVMRVPPQSWADWEPVRGGAASHAALRDRLADAPVWQVVAQPNEALALKAQHTPPWWQGLLTRQRHPVQQGVPPAGAVGMVWANMLLHHAPEPLSLMSQWHQALHTDGFLMFSCLGPDTLKEVRQVHRLMGWPEPAHQFTDMHDWGDLLLQSGFAQPVMDVERITLTFASAPRLLQELRELGRNLSVDRWGGLRARAWLQRWLEAMSQHGQRDANGQLQLTFEVIYGHAHKPPARLKVQPHTTIDVAQMRQMLAQSARRPQ